MTNTRIIPLMAVLVFIAGVMMAAIIPSTHAADKHGLSDVQKIIQCASDPANILQIWENPCNGRRVMVCQPDDRFAIVIMEAVKGTWQNITCFFKEKLNSTEKVCRYCENRGLRRLR